MKKRSAQRNPVAIEACLLVYDGGCRLCVETKHRLERADPRRAGPGIRFVPYDSEEAKQALGARYTPGRPDAAYLVSPTGEVREGLDAFIPLLPGVPGGRILMWFLRLHFIKRAAEVLYRAVARHRYRLFGKARPARPRV
jgi:predicted DCC family thiol-disulfide oxidoreductase YuxK